MKTVLSYVFAAVLVGGGAWLVWVIVSGWIRWKWPPAIPDAIGFRHVLESEKKLREIAEALVPLFRGHDREDVRCLGPVRGVAGRVLFHSGPENRGANVNIHRPDYVLHVVRLGERRVRLELRVNRPYSRLRLNRAEVTALSGALRAAYGELERV